jgi:hypothetical protein
MKIEFNQDMIIPPFLDRSKSLTDAKQTNSLLSKLNKKDDRNNKRELIPLSELNVARDIMDFSFVLKSNIEVTDI